MSEEFIPQSLRVALTVTEEEYLKARSQCRWLWVGTFAAILAGLGLWFAGLRFTAMLVQPILLAVGAHALLFAALPEARKMSTQRLRKYKELREWRAARAGTSS